MILENQLFAPTLKGVIDFLRTLQGKGLTKKINKLLFKIPDTHINLKKVKGFMKYCKYLYIVKLKIPYCVQQLYYQSFKNFNSN